MGLKKSSRLLIAGYAALVAAYSCNREPAIETIGDYLGEVRVGTSENALRIPLSIDFSKACTYHIEYWQRNRNVQRRSTREFAAKGGKEDATVMFLYPETAYSYEIVVTSGEKTFRSEQGNFTTGTLPEGLPEYTVSASYPAEDIGGYIFQWQATSPGYVVFCDTDGNIVWYEILEMAARQVTYDPATRTISMLLGFKTGQNDPKFQRWCKKIVLMDLEGRRTIDIETSESNIDFPHHEIKRMPDGNIAILHGVVKNFDLTAVGGQPDTPVYGDGITVITPELEKIWSWDCFEELDPTRDEYLDAAVRSTDLVHANSIGWDEKGNIYFTLNHLNELWKIDRNTGKVLYRVGDYGNMALAEEDHASGLHAAEPLAEDKVLCLDNGSDKGISRAIIYEMDTVNKSAEITLSVAIPSDLSSRDRSNAQLSADGKMLFFGSTMGRACIFTDLEGNVKKVLKRTGISYRSYYYENIDY